jgi:hypothetical protein
LVARLSLLWSHSASLSTSDVKVSAALAPLPLATKTLLCRSSLASANAPALNSEQNRWCLRPLRGGGSETCSCAISFSRYSSLDAAIGAPNVERRFLLALCDARKPLRLHLLMVDGGALLWKTPLWAMSRMVTSCHEHKCRSAVGLGNAHFNVRTSQPEGAIACSTRRGES